MCLLPAALECYLFLYFSLFLLFSRLFFGFCENSESVFLSLCVCVLYIRLDLIVVPLFNTDVL